MTNEESFHRVDTWLRDLRAHADPDVVICLAGNKCDKTPTFDLSVCEEQARALGAQFFKTSALTGEGINEVFESLSIGVVEVHKSRNAPKDTADTVALGGRDAAASQGSGCC